MYNHLTTELNPATTVSKIRLTITRMLSAYAAHRLCRKHQAILEGLDARVRYDIGHDDIADRPASLAAQNPRVLAVSLQLLRQP